MSSKKCLVTGGAGFIGSHLVERLLTDGHHVIVVDNMVAGTPNNLDAFKGDPRLQIQADDVSDSDAIKPLFEGIDWVFHLAAMADIVPSIEDPISYHRANVEGTITVLEHARTYGIERFIYAASSSGYGMPDIFPTPESAPAQPMYPYALTKHIGEQYVMHWQALYGLPAISLRMFNVFGPRHRSGGTYGAVFGVFMAQKLAGKPFTVVGDGEQTRDFTYVTDVADAFVTAAASDISGEIFNVGSGGTYSLNHLVELLDGEVEYIPKRPGEPDCTFADTSRIEEVLGWKAHVPFEEGVKTMLEHIEGWRGAPVWDGKNIAEATADWFKYLGR